MLPSHIKVARCYLDRNSSVLHIPRMRKDDPQINLRIPPDLKERIQQAAKSNRRTQTAEILARLEESFKADTAISGKDFGQMTAHEFLEEQRTTAKQYLEALEKLQKGEG